MFEDYFNELLECLSQNVRQKTPRPTNIACCDDYYLISIQVPGFPKGTLDVEIIPQNSQDNLDRDMISIKGNALSVDNLDNLSYKLQEFETGGRFERKFYLPVDSDTDKIKASHADGVLFVQIPRKTKIEEKSTKMITIE